MTPSYWIAAFLYLVSIAAYSNDSLNSDLPSCQTLVQESFESPLAQQRENFSRLKSFFRKKLLADSNTKLAVSVDSYFDVISQAHSLVKIDDVIENLKTVVAPYQNELASFLSSFVTERSKRLSGQILDLLSLPSSRTRFVDIGCAGGEMLRELSKSSQTMMELIGIDIFTPEMAPIEYKYYKVEPTNTIYPLESQSVDVVSMMMVLHHENNFEQLIRESHRVLKKNGILVIKEHNAETAMDSRYFGDRDRILSEVFFRNNSIGIGKYRSLLAWTEKISRYGFVLEREVMSNDEDGFLVFRSLDIMPAPTVDEVNHVK